MPSTTISIFLIGIAAVVSAPPQAIVPVSVIFPAARAGSYQGLELASHQTFLYVKGASLAATDKSQNCTVELTGQWDAAADLCTIKLTGALIWTRTSEQLTQDATFRKIPSFSAICPTAVDLPPEYTDEVLEEIVAAHVDITGGTLRGCTRGLAFVTTHVVATDDGTLYVKQRDRTMRMVLNEGATVGIENKPDDVVVHDEKKHVGWYYYMNRSRLTCPIQIPTPTLVSACPVGIPGLPTMASQHAQLPPPMISAASGSGCSNNSYP